MLAARFTVILVLGMAVFPHLCRAEKTLPIRGWLVHWPDKAYLKRVLEAAPRYKINHLELSHDIIMQADEAADDMPRAALIEETSKTAKSLGIDAYIWSHELNTADKNPVLDPKTEAGAAFWNRRRAAYRNALKNCPSVAGVVLMFGSSPTEVWDARIRDDWWLSPSMAQRVRYVTDLVREVVVGEMHRKLIVRDFNHSPNQLKWLIEGLKDCPDITLHSKSEPQDFQPFYPHSSALGAYGNCPQIAEIDLNGEYWGQSLVPVSQVAYLRYRLQNCVQKGVVGAVGRIDTYQNSALGTPSEINLYAYTRLLQDVDTPEATIYDDWIRLRYGFKPGSRESRLLRTILTRTWLYAQKTFYTLGFWTWKNQSSIPDRSLSIDGNLRGKSTAQWDATAKPTEARLLNPDRGTVRVILSEKADAVRLAETNLTEIAALKGSLTAADYTTFEHRLRLAVDLAHIYSAIADAYWHTRLHETAPTDSEASTEQCLAAIAKLDIWADKLSRYEKENPQIAAQAARLHRLADDLRTRTKQK